MVDVFEEVEEQLRTDRYKALALKSLPWIGGVLALALVVALGIWGYQSYRAKAHADASEQYAAAGEAFTTGQRDEALRLWGEVAKSSSRAYKSLALQQLGGVQLSDNKVAEAVKLFDQAAEAAPTPVLGDMARLKSAFALLDSSPYKDMEARLKPLTEEGRPYRVQAREALAFAKIMAGDLAGARTEFSVLSLMVDSGEGVSQRAKAAIALIDSGSAKAVPGAVKAALALPQPIALAPGALPPGLQAQPAPQQQAPGPQ